jgi:hypothetical protein
MKGQIESGRLCTVAPVDLATLNVGDIVLCKIAGNEYLHIVKAINGERFQMVLTGSLSTGTSITSSGATHSDSAL